jgi:hypothetical protein
MPSCLITIFSANLLFSRLAMLENISLKHGPKVVDLDDDFATAKSIKSASSAAQALFPA